MSATVTSGAGCRRRVFFKEAGGLGEKAHVAFDLELSGGKCRHAVEFPQGDSDPVLGGDGGGDMRVMNAFHDFYGAVIDGNGPVAAAGARDDIAVIGGDALDPVRVDPGFHGAENIGNRYFTGLCFFSPWVSFPNPEGLFSALCRWGFAASHPLEFQQIRHLESWQDSCCRTP